MDKHNGIHHPDAVDIGTAADVEAVMKKYDRESNVRVWTGKPKIIISVLMTAFSLYCIIDAVFLTTLPEIRLSVFMGMIVLLGFLTFPVRKGIERPNHIPWYDIVILVLGAGSFFFYAANAMEVIRLSARVIREPKYMIAGILAILALAELCRRCVGLPILCVAGALLIYTFSTYDKRNFQRTCTGLRQIHRHIHNIRRVP